MNIKNVSIVVLILSIITSIFLQSYVLQRRIIGRDHVSNFYDMKRHLESGKLPTTGSRLDITPNKNGEYTTARVPGGAYYIIYTMFYKLSNENIILSKIINMIFNLIITLFFLIWFYKRFGIFITSIFSVLLLVNGYFVMSTTNFWNPNVTLIFSLLFFMMFFEYCYGYSEKNIRLSAVFIFPILAIMSQGHLATFFSMIPAFIVYLIIRFNNTKKYLYYFLFGVFISFLLYIPYLVSEINSNFNNLKLALHARNTMASLPFPQFHALFIFPTNEMSIFFGTRGDSIKYFWMAKPPYIFGMIFLLLSLAFSLLCFIRAYVLFFRKKIISTNDRENKNKYKAIHESMLLLLLLIPVSILCFLIGKSKAVAFHYLYSAYGLSFVPVILFFSQNEKRIMNDNKKLVIVSSLLIINMFALTGQIVRYIKMFEAPRDYNVMKEMANFFKDDTKGLPMKILSKYSGDMSYAYMDIMDTYFPEYKINTSADNAEVFYTIRDNIMAKNWSKERRDKDNSYVITNATEVTNIGVFTVFKFHDGYRE